jgi:hypothetical protein
VSWRDAPLYVETQDLALWVIERAARWSCADDRLLAPLVARSAADLTSAVSLALTFPQTRREHLEEADHAVVRLRNLLRLAHGLGLLPANGLRFATGRLDAVGRMIGGWHKRVGAVEREHSPERSAIES